MILSGKEIQRELGKRIFIEPFDPSRLNPNSYNLTLHDELLVYDSPVLDMKKPNPAHTIRIPAACIWAAPGSLPAPKALSPCWKAGLPWGGWGFLSM